MTDHVDAPSTRPEFVIPVRPAGVPPGLCELRPDIHVVGIEPHGAHYTTAGKLANHIQGTIERQAAGRFYLWEAAQILADSHGKSLEGIRDAMRRAVSLGALCVRVVGSDEPMSAGSRLRIDGMDSYVTPEGLNEWLEAGRYPYRFPVAAAPSASPAACPDAGAAPAAPEAPDSASAPAGGLPEAVAVPAESVRVRTPTVQQVIAPYVAKLMKEHPEYTANALYRRMRRDAGEDGSPFAKLGGGELFCVEASRPCGISTVASALTAYRKSIGRPHAPR